VPDDLVLARGRTFLVTSPDGDLDADPSAPQGLFHADTRHLHCWRVLVDGRAPVLLSLGGDDTWWRSVSVPPADTDEHHPRPPWALTRRRHLAAGRVRDELEVVSYADVPLTLAVRVEVAADFADQLALRWPGARPQGRLEQQAAGSRLELCYARGDFVRTTTLAAAEARADGGGLTWDVELAPGERWSAAVEVVLGAGGDPVLPAVADVAAAADADDAERRSFLAAAPELDTDWVGLQRAYEQGLRDLASLRLPVPGRPDLAVVGAGRPWFLTLFGRDSLITGWMALPYLPALAAGALVALAGVQGEVDAPLREEEPGKIVHELREGELTACGDLPFGRYYGTVDATALWLVLLDEYHRWTGDDELVQQLEQPARAALSWLDRRAYGYLSYVSHNPEGLRNQCWKDSPGSMRFADGSLADGTIAVCEAQGYAFDAWRRAARLARDVWSDQALASRCDDLAADLQRRFVTDFWLPDKGILALALDGEGRQVDATTSNLGHLLWSGILPHDLGVVVGRRLLEPDLFSGWGVRTMSTEDGGYHPLDYHDGSVWPHDTAVVAAGLARYGLHDEAGRLARAVIDAAAWFGDRLPEVFAGYQRDQTGMPVRYPTACSPQAWAAAVPLSVVTTVLGRGPEGDGESHLPEGVQRLRLVPRRGLVGRDA
jgi:glycogen debranching enzyme